MTEPERLDDTRRVIVIRCSNCGEPWQDGHEMTCEDLDPELTCSREASGPDPVMQWGVRWANGAVTVERDQEAASLAADIWTARGVNADLVSRVCGPWQ